MSNSKICETIANEYWIIFFKLQQHWQTEGRRELICGPKVNGEEYYLLLKANISNKIWVNKTVAFRQIYLMDTS